MTSDARSRQVRLLLSDYGMLLILLLLCGFFSATTIAEQHPTGPAAARQLASMIRSLAGKSARVAIVVREHDEDATFAEELRRSLEADNLTVAVTIRGVPADARKGLSRLAEAGDRIDAIACTQVTAGWSIYPALTQKYPSLAGARIYQPRGYRWPNFLKTENLLNIANQIAVIAIIAIGMTTVIITGGIDLSVGSLIALSAVVTSRLIRDVGGGESATTAGMIACSLAGILACSATGAFSGLMVTRFQIPPFIATLAMMLVASGMAYILADGQSINQVPERFIWLGRGADLGYIPNAVVLMLVLYGLAHILMGQTVIGRYIYAVGGNSEAARLSGVPTLRIYRLAYMISGTLAGLGGVIMASQLKSGAPTYGQMYELYVIAAVVVGGTSLSGGEGKVLGTLIGAFIIAVIQNGMNLKGVESYTQKIILGFVILGSVLLDRIRRKGA